MPSTQQQAFDFSDLTARAAPAPPRFAAWQEFHRENPLVFAKFRQFAIQAYLQGSKQGARSIGERIRWDVEVETRGGEFKVNDHHWPYYARLLAGLDERFKEFFVFKDKHFDTTTEAIVRFHKGIKR